MLNIDFLPYKHIFFIGIGGIGVSALARICKQKGIKVSGSDSTKSELTSELEKEGIKIYYSHKKENIENTVDLVVKTSAVKENEETIEAKKRGIELLSRGAFLAIIANKYRLIAIAGSHGKTTTSSLTAFGMSKTSDLISFNIGGILPNFKTNSFISDSEFFITESDESDGSFLYLKPEIAVITNLDPEHLDYYGSFEKLKEAVIQFANSSKFVIWGYDSQNLKEISKYFKSPNISFGFDKNSDFVIEKTENSPLKLNFKLNSENINKTVSFPLIGDYNALNGGAVALLFSVLNINLPDFSDFLGVKRRMERVYYSKTKNISFYDDYAHHPKEIDALVSTLLSFSEKLIIIFQPHRYTRTRDSFNDFTNVLSKIPNLIVLKEYGASEEIIQGATAKDIFNTLLKENHNYLRFAESKLEAIENLKNILEGGEKVVSIGAGNVNQILYHFKEINF
ncbi:UDP-N-acetylmuramate--L-alanine ligase [bacterium]|nr:UDP-N-acetylmuramate--L-alanine ligase [bacterium]